MGLFATMGDAEARAREKMADGTWVVAHSMRLNGVIGIRFMRFMSPANPDHGGWVETTDDTVE